MVDLSIEIDAGQGAVQGSDRILGAAFHAGLALGLVVATKRAGRTISTILPKALRSSSIVLDAPSSVGVYS
jgi:hypothetical protein